MARLTKSVEYLRHNFSQDELIVLGSDLAEAYQQLDQIDNEEAVIKAQIKERKAGIQQKIGTLSRNISARFDMQNIDCKLEYDAPNVGEVSYIRVDNGEVAKVRPMTVSERQQEIEFVPPVEKSEEAIESFFDPDAIQRAAAAGEEKDEPEPARQEPLITMGDAKKNRRKKEEPESKGPPSDSGAVITDEDLPF